MNGKYCLVTGATQGIGLETARALAAGGAHVLVHGRDMSQARAACERLAGATGGERLQPVAADFADLAQVRRLAGELAAALPRLDVLVNNAGMMSAARGRSAEGYDLTFQVNHLAPFLLTRLLLPRLAASTPARIVVVSSAAHRRAQLDFSDLMNERVAGLMPAYARSKLANLLFVRALAPRLAGSGVTVNALHPGLVRSHIFHRSRPLAGVLAVLGPLFMLTPARGARTSIFLATAPQVEGLSGAYYERCRPVQPSAAAQDAAAAERLWRESERLTGLPAA